MGAVLHPKPSLRLDPWSQFEAPPEQVVSDAAVAELAWEPIGEDFWAGADGAERLVRRFLVFCESPRTRGTALALVRGSVAGGRTGRRVYGFINRLVVNPALQATGIKASAMRMELVASQLIGMAMMRYVLEVEPMASATPDEIVELMAPSIRAALEKDKVEKDKVERDEVEPVAIEAPRTSRPPDDSWFSDFTDDTVVLPRDWARGVGIAESGSARGEPGDQLRP